MSKTIWIINEYAGSKYHGMEFRHYYVGRELVKRGYDVYIITASYSHLLKELPKVKYDFTIENIDNLNYVWVKVPKYSHTYDKRRVLKWFVFASKLFRLPKDKIKKPDAIIVSPMPPFPIIAGYYYSKKFNAKLIFEVKDLWPLTLVEIGKYSKYHPLIVIMQFFEDFAYKKSDFVISVLPNAYEYMKKHGLKKEKFFYIPNGISLEEIENVQPLDAETINKIPRDKFIVGYVGTIGSADTLEYLIKAADLLKEKKDIHFVLVGDGSEKSRLIEMVSDMKLENVTFINSIPKSQVQSILKYFDVCFIGWEKERIYNYGISANKIFDYMYSGKPILHAYSGQGDLIKIANCGLSVEAENLQAITKGILDLYNMSREEREKLGENGKNFVLKYHTYDKIVERFIEAINV